MFNRKDAVMAAVAGLLASCGLAMADSPLKSPVLSLEPSVVTAQAGGSDKSLLMQGLDRAGVGSMLSDYGLNVYGWIEGGYTWNHRGNHADQLIIPGPFNHEYGDHFMMNQLVLRLEKAVDPTKFDVGGMIELMYGSDAARIHSYGGGGYDGSDLSDNNDPNDPLAVANLHPIWQFDVPQAYVDVNVPVGNGLKIRAGKFVTLMGYETIDPRTNPFYSHSYLFSAIPFTHFGVLGSYQINEQLGTTVGVTRGWDMFTEDNNGCAIDVIGQVVYTPSKSIKAVFNYSVGPENFGDTGHYRVAANPILYWQVTEQMLFGVEGLYIYDGGYNGSPGDTGHYGDVWGVALYGSYKINDMFTVNARAEKAHTYLGSFGGIDIDSFGGVPTLNMYEFTLGVTITPLPNDQYFKGFMIRPEVRYDWCEDDIYQTSDGGFQDQLTFGADLIFQF
jgi:hypothetical protein